MLLRVQYTTTTTRTRTCTVHVQRVYYVRIYFRTFVHVNNVLRDCLFVQRTFVSVVLFP